MAGEGYWPNRLSVSMCSRMSEMSDRVPQLPVLTAVLSITWSGRGGGIVHAWGLALLGGRSRGQMSLSLFRQIEPAPRLQCESSPSWACTLVCVCVSPLGLPMTVPGPFPSEWGL